MVTINNYGDGTCVWCLTHGEGVQATFKDGLAGFLCRKHFWEALKARAEQSDERRATTANEKRSQT